MRQSKVLEERIRRARLLLKELGYEITEDQRSPESYSATFEREDGVEGGIFIDRESRFVEVGYTFSFSPDLETFIRGRLEDMLKVCYEYGCYFGLQRTAQDIGFSVFSKLYYTGLTYYSLRDTLRDFRLCVQALGELLKIENSEGEPTGQSEAQS